MYLNGMKKLAFYHKHLSQKPTHNNQELYLRIQSESGKMREKCGPEQLRIRTLFMQW